MKKKNKFLYLRDENANKVLDCFYLNKKNSSKIINLLLILGDFDSKTEAFIYEVFDNEKEQSSFKN